MKIETVEQAMHWSKIETHRSLGFGAAVGDGRDEKAFAIVSMMMALRLAVRMCKLSGQDRNFFLRKAAQVFDSPGTMYADDRALTFEEDR